MKLSSCLVILILLAGCGAPTSDAEEKPTPEGVKTAYRFIQEGNIEELKRLLMEDPSIANTPYRKDSLLNIVIDTRPEYPRMHASTKILLDAGADPNMNAPQLLRKAIWRGEPDIYKLLLDYGADPRIIWKKKNIDMLEYSRSYEDERFDEITDAWEKAQRQ
jgi:hypothetical protein